MTTTDVIEMISDIIETISDKSRYKATGTMSGHTFKAVEIHSGEITSTGIKNYHFAQIMTMETPTSLKRGQGRLFKDGDGFSKKTQIKISF